jgi:hypothetical protein
MDQGGEQDGEDDRVDEGGEDVGHVEDGGDDEEEEESVVEPLVLPGLVHAFHLGLRLD